MVVTVPVLMSTSIHIILLFLIFDSATNPCINVTICGSHGTCVNINFNAGNINIFKF